MQALGLKHITLPDIVCNHILPSLHNTDQVSHIAYMAVIISSGLTAPEAANPLTTAKFITKLKEVGKIATNHGFLQLKDNFLHLPVSLGNKVRTIGSIDS